MSYIPPALTTEMFSSTGRKSNSIGEDVQIEILENEHVNLNISEFNGSKEAYLASVIASYAKTLTQDKLHYLGDPIFNHCYSHALTFFYFILSLLMHACRLSGEPRIRLQ